MVSLRMKGRQISNLARFYESFDLEQLLLQRQAFLAFANACLQLFDLDEYVVKVFSAANEKKDEIVKDAGSAFLDDFWNNPFGFALKDAAFEDALKRQREPEPNSAEEERNRLVHSVFQALGEAKMENGEKRALYYLVSAAMLLGRVPEANRTVDAESLLLALSGQKPVEEETSEADRWIKMPEEDEEIVLRAGKIRYRVQLFDGDKLDESDCIRVVRVRAAKAKRGGSYVSVHLSLCEKEESAAAAAYTLTPGEYLYFLCVGECAVKPMCVRITAGNRSLERRKLDGDDLFYTYSDGKTRKLPSSMCAGVSGFALETDADGYMLVRDHRLDASHFSSYGSCPQFSILEYRRVVDVAIVGSDYLVLQENGRVYSSRAEWNGLRHIVALEDVTGDARVKRIGNGTAEDRL